jgi:hypothetical protein
MSSEDISAERKNVTLEEVTTIISETEEKIMKAVREFQERTGLGVEDIELRHTHLVGVRNPAVVHVKLEVRM